MPDVLLVKPHSKHLIVPPLGLGYLSSSLKRHGITSKIIHCAKDKFEISAIVKLIKKENIEIVGVTCCSNEHLWLLKLAKELANLPQVYLIVGGPHATGLANRLMELVPRINFIISSEGELAFPKLVEYLKNKTLNDSDLKRIPNLIWKNTAAQVIANPVRLPSNLNTIPFPDWNQMRPSEYEKLAPHGGFGKASPVAPLITTRGCPYACNYCAGSLLNGKKIRQRDAESVLEEIKFLMSDYNVKEFTIEDDNFTFYKDHVIDICRGIRNNNINAFFTLPNGIRIDRIDDEILKELQTAGFYSITLGIESGKQETLKRMNKALDLKIIKENIASIRKYNFQIKAYFMLGYPGETKNDIIKTIEFAKSLDLDRAYFTMYIPLPGTRDFQMLEEQGKINVRELDWKNFYTKGKTIPPYVPNGMTSSELEKFAHLAYREFYIRPKIIAKLIRDIRIKSFKQFAEVAWNLSTLNLSYFI